MANDPVLTAIMNTKAKQHANRISGRLQKLARLIDKELRAVALPGEPDPAFGLFVFTAGAAQYVGGGEREDIKRVVASVLHRWDDPAYTTLHKPLHEKTEAELEQEKDDPL